MFCYDDPARSFVCDVLGHTAKSGCAKCNQKGYKLPKNGIIFETKVRDQRTDLGYNLRVDQSHHQPQYLNKLELIPMQIMDVDDDGSVLLN